jgi:glycosyltransferase 2 family protein
VTETDASAVPKRGRRDALVRWALLVLVVTGFVVAVGERWSDVGASLGSVSPVTLAGAWALATVGLVGPWHAWHTVVSDLGPPVPRRSSTEIFFIGQLGKYVPGAIWPVVVQMRLARSVGVTRTRVAVSFVITLILGVATGLLVGMLAVPSLVEESSAWWAWTLVLAPFAVVALFPRVLGWVATTLLRLTRRQPVDTAISGRGVLLAISGTCFFWVVGGLHLWLVVVDIGGDAVTSLPVSLGVLALAVSLGPLFVLLPAGAGVREAVLVAGLSAVLPVPAAVAAALISRALLVAGDGALALVAFVLARRAPA